MARLRRRLSPPPTDVPTFESAQVDLTFSFLAFPREVEYMIEEVFTYLPRELQMPARGVVFDVGANQGIFSVFASGLAEGVRVFSFEPIPDIHAVCLANRALYNVQGHAYNAGLSRARGVSSQLGLDLRPPPVPGVCARRRRSWTRPSTTSTRAGCPITPPLQQRPPATHRGTFAPSPACRANTSAR